MRLDEDQRLELRLEQSDFMPPIRNARRYAPRHRIYRNPTNNLPIVASLTTSLTASLTAHRFAHRSLATLSHEVKKYAAETLEDEGEGSIPQFLADGEFEIYLDSACTRVKRGRKRPWQGNNSRTEPASSPLRMCPSPTRRSRSQFSVKVNPAQKYATIVPDDDDDTVATDIDGIDISVPDAVALIMQQVEHEEAVNLTVEKVRFEGSERSELPDAVLHNALIPPSHRFAPCLAWSSPRPFIAGHEGQTAHTLPKEEGDMDVGESTVAFLSTVQELRETAATVKVIGSRLRLVRAGTASLAARYLVGNHINRFPEECQEAARKAAEKHGAAGDDANGLLDAFSNLEQTLQKSLVPVLEAVRHDQTHLGRVTKSNKKKTRVVIC